VVKQKLHKSLQLAILGEVIGLVIGLFILYVILPRLAFVTLDYQNYLPIGVVAAWIQVPLKLIGYLVLKIAHLLNSIALGVQFYALFKLLIIFPFDFRAIHVPQLNTMMAMAFGLSLV
jgi:ethanolamine transporter EutH